MMIVARNLRVRGSRRVIAMIVRISSLRVFIVFSMDVMMFMCINNDHKRVRRMRMILNMCIIC